MEKKISVALATYKGAPYIAELLESLSQQHLLPFELVVSDDNSPDETLSIVAAFSANAPFKVKIVSNEKQLGIIKNFAVAFDNCEGDLIAYCDQDDVWMPDKLATLYRCFERPDVKLAMHRSEVVNSKLESLGYCISAAHGVEAGEVIFPSTIDMTYGLGHQMLFDAQMYRNYAWIFRKNLLPLQSAASNYDVQLRLMAGLSGNIISLEKVLVKFRRHVHSTSDAGRVDPKTATTSGFLNKSTVAYKQQADEFAALAVVFSQEIFPKMPEHRDQLQKYIDFLKERSKTISLRSVIYQSSSIWTRQKSFWYLLWRGAYVPKIQRGLGRRAALVDAFVSLFGLHRAQSLVARRQGL